MKKLLILSIALAFYGVATAQDFNVTVYGSYVFDDSFDSYYDIGEYYDGTIEGGLQWGIGAEYKARPYVGVEVTYLRQDTKAPTTYQLRSSGRASRTDFDLGINYLMIGGNHYFGSPNAPFQGYGGLMAGVMFANVENPDLNRSDDATKFSWGAKLGGIYWMNDYVGIKMQAQLLSAVQAAGGGVYFGGYGPQAGLTTYSTIYQFGLGGGLVFSLN
ncbi:hypothetical protein [Galbibacter mesophilus]|uniref:hypothetical protein n=1 Tax=Galbibacter mesophilus TaxID=379069 RepID=UPI00191CB196|nr:hypothetical protein [Galbibacter mesophilus]MCM5662693.1 hypothetical protein [Galbibacter mesophilus]